MQKLTGTAILKNNSYIPSVNIELQIGNIVATVTTITETLLESPALSENGVTMVPLRFISETFGATVGYDNDTQAILVTKEIWIILLPLQVSPI